LLSPEHMKQAEILGKAMRLGAMLWLTADEQPGALKWKPKTRELTLRLTEHARPLFGEVAEARFAALVLALDATGDVQFVQSAGKANRTTE
ncbi:MAG: exopolyphosphatase, partial [Paracoccaceae bacterium]|nr:exopolyphosphatase [Paracoccaceae bacterium]